MRVGSARRGIRQRLDPIADSKRGQKPVPCWLSAPICDIALDLSLLWILHQSSQKGGGEDRRMIFKIAEVINKLKGSLTWDFRHEIFFHKSVSPGPLSIPLGPFQILFENSRRYLQMNVRSSAVSTTPEKKNKNFEIQFFFIFCWECGGAPSVPSVFPASTVTWPIIPHICCTYVFTRLSLPSLKYTVVAWLLTRVRRSYSLKAKTSENVGIFVLALKRKKMFFFALFATKRNTPNSEKNESENESEVKREAKSYNSSKSLKVSF